MSEAARKKALFSDRSSYRLNKQYIIHLLGQYGDFIFINEPRDRL